MGCKGQSQMRVSLTSTLLSTGIARRRHQGWKKGADINTTFTPHQVFSGCFQPPSPASPRQQPPVLGRIQSTSASGRVLQANGHHPASSRSWVLGWQEAMDTGPPDQGEKGPCLLLALETALTGMRVLWV